MAPQNAEVFHESQIAHTHRARSEGVNADAIKASIDKGVLKVTVPKPATAQVKKIDVKAAA